MQKSASGSAALGIARGMVGCEEGTTSTAKALLHTNFCLMSDKTIAYWDKKLDIDKGNPAKVRTNQLVRVRTKQPVKVKQPVRTNSPMRVAK